MSYIFFRRGIYNKFYKKDEIYDRIVQLYKVRGIFNIFIGITFLIIDFIVVPAIYQFYSSYGLTPPILTQYVFYILMGLALILCFLGVQSIFKNISKKEVNEKLKKYSTVELVNISEFFDYKSNYLYLCLVGIILGFIAIGIIVPLYDLIAKIEYSDEINISNSEMENWNVYDIKNSVFAFKYPNTTQIQETSECIKVTQGLAYLTIAKPGKNSHDICSYKYDYNAATTPIDLELIIDESEYRFSGVFIDGRKSTNKKSGEIYKNNNAIFGNGYNIEFGGDFENNAQQQYIRDKEVIKAILESSFRKDKNINSFQDCVDAGYSRTKSYPGKCVTDDGREFIQEVENFNNPTEKIISGKIVCLPKINTGDFQTMECAIGVLSDDGNYYGFKNLEAFNKNYKYSTTDLRVKIEGKILPKEVPIDSGFNNHIYDILGVIEITSIEDL